MQHIKTFKFLQSFFFTLLITNVFWFCLAVYWLFKEYRVCFDSWLKKRCSPPWQGRCASRSITQLETLHSQSRRYRDEFLNSSCFLVFIQPKTPTSEISPSTFRFDLLSSVHLSETASQTHIEVCFQSDSKTSQVDNQCLPS